MQQAIGTAPALAFFDELVASVRPGGILEMGTGEGPLAIYLWVWSQLLENGCLVMSVDKISRPSLGRFAARVPGLEFVVGDFNDPAVIARMTGFLDKTKPPRLLLCDGAARNVGARVDTKLGQLKFTMARAAIGDYVLSHDFKAPEFGGVTEAELARWEKRYGFERCRQELSVPAAWSCSVKKE